MDVITSMLSALFQKLIDLVSWAFNAIFGNWNYGVLFSWLPQDIQAAVTYFILVMFGIALFKFIRSIIPI